MDKIISFVIKIYKKVRPAKRLYKYGTVGLCIYDDRTLKEKIFDYIDEFVFQYEQKQRCKRAYRKAVWNSYFDCGLGTVITGMDMIRKKEKQGYAYISDNELRRVSAYYRQRNEAETKARHRKKIREGIAAIKQGRSNFTNELRNKLK